MNWLRRTASHSCLALLCGLGAGCESLTCGGHDSHESPVMAAVQHTELAPSARTAPVEPQHATIPAAGAAQSSQPLFAGMAELSVEALVQQVLARNPSLDQMVAAWQAASARYPQVTALEDPMLATMVAPASIDSRDVEFGYRIEVSQKYPFPGKRALRGQSALAEASAAGHDVEDLRLQLVESTRSAFADYYLALRALAVNEEGLRLLDQFRQKAQERYELVPGANQQDVKQAIVEVGRQRQRRVALERARHVAVARLNTLLHLPPDSPLPPPPGQLGPWSALPEAGQLRAEALARRPDLHALADRIHAEQASLELAHKQYCPDFEVAAAYDTIMGNGPTRDLAAQVGVRMNLPVRTARLQAAVAEAQARLAQRQAELTRQIDQVSFQVQEAYEQVQESERVVRLYEDTVLKAAQENVEAARSAYETGKIPFLSLLEAQRNVVELRQGYYETLAEALRRRATLERVTGAAAASVPAR